jgi:hypothetical protein
MIPGLQSVRPQVAPLGPRAARPLAAPSAPCALHASLIKKRGGCDELLNPTMRALPVYTSLCADSGRAARGPRVS